MSRHRARKPCRSGTLASHTAHGATIALVATALLGHIAGTVQAQELPSDPFYQRPWNHVSMQDKLYFNTERPPGLFEYDPAPRPHHPRGRVRALNYDPPSLGSLLATTDRLYYQRSNDRDRMYVWSGFEQPLRSIPWGLRPPWEVGEIDGAPCIAGVRDADGTFVWRPPACVLPATLLGQNVTVTQPVALGDRLFFVRSYQIFVVDPGTERARPLMNLDTNGPLVTAGQNLLIGSAPWSSQPELWKIGPGDAMPVRLGSFPLNDFPAVAHIGSTVYYQGTDPVHGKELWRSDGTAEGTRMVADIAPGAIGAEPNDLVVLNGVLYFRANGPEGWELWRSDGTADGTRLVRDIHRRGGSFPNDLCVAGGRLYFQANDGLTGTELYESDGTESGTRVIDLNPAPQRGAYPWSLTVVGDDLYFWAEDGTWPATLWRVGASGPASVLSYHRDKALVIDGDFSDWPCNPRSSTSFRDDTGDVTGDGAIDLLSAEACAAGDVMYFRYQTATPLDFASDASRLQVFFDTDRRSATGYRANDPAFSIGAEYLLQGSVLLRYTGSGEDWTWEPVATAAHATSRDQAELSVDTTELPGRRIIGSRVLMRAQNPVTDDYAAPR